MRCAIMQPTYLPWLGYFELMYNCDVFVFLDDVQFIENGWHRRNKIKINSGEHYLVVPVLTKNVRFQKINQTIINNQTNWKKKHFMTIDLNYKKSRYYNLYQKELMEIYSQEYNLLVDLNLSVINFLKQKFGIKTKTILSSELNINGQKEEKIIGICKKLGADTLYDAEGAKEILNSNFFSKKGIEIIFQKYNHPVYHQLHGNFISHLSSLDLLLNEGNSSLDIILNKEGCYKNA